ncbi:DUF4231 domain-containing protein [Streptomyces nigrescens]
MEAHGGNAAIRTVWERQNVWSQAARAQKASVGQGRLIALLLGIGAAVLGTLASQLMEVSSGAGRAAAFAAAVAGGAVPLAARRSSPQEAQEWTRLRSMAEALKSEVYAHLATVGRRDEAAGQDLLEQLAQLEESATGLAHHTAGIRPEERPLPPVSDIESYVVHRLRQQIDGYYRPQALRMRGHVRRIRRTETALALIGAALGGVAGAFGIEQAGVWIAVVTLVATSVTAHAAAARYAYQELEYFRTASELETLLLRWESAAQEGRAGDEFVQQCERIISVQNDAWMVKWTTD